MEEEREAVPAAVASSPASCSFLFPGRSFTGQQRLSSPQRPQEDWAVTATIYSCDLARGRVTGSMVAQNSPLAKRPIVTYFEGEIIDNINHTFWTGCKWGTCPSRETDVRYWSRCPGFTSSLRAAIVQNNGRAQQLSSCTHVFMRWKECFFVDVPQDCPLTITGFYYLSLDRQSGSIGGYYHDSRSAPLQVRCGSSRHMCWGEFASLSLACLSLACRLNFLNSGFISFGSVSDISFWGLGSMLGYAVLVELLVCAATGSG
ncbi:hypothetical protein Vafri_20374 [Volvox africanus]|uniref:Uncharacterized protein n=1 Tax=Volvox africanus TaxID=51714 RepID=A0A8J4BR96_9CHLO|nr:hypothetical protein Vafri_20374 [Volvox africanus]